MPHSKEDKQIMDIVHILENALVQSDRTTMVTVEYADGWYIDVTDTDENEFSIEVTKTA